MKNQIEPTNSTATHRSAQLYGPHTQSIPTNAIQY